MNQNSDCAVFSKSHADLGAGRIHVVLLNPPYVSLSSNTDLISKFVCPALGISSLASFLQESDSKVSLFDLNLKMFFEIDEKLKYLWDKDSRNLWVYKTHFAKSVIPLISGMIENYVDKIINLKADFVGFPIFFTSELISCYMAKRIKEKNKNTLVVFGGPGCTANNAEYFIQGCGVDVVVIGEAEETLLEIVNNFKRAGRLIPCKGGFFKIKEEIIYGGERDLIKDIDTLPFPDFSQCIADYRQYNRNDLCIPISWVRGCINKCTFCFGALFWKYARARSPKSICDEFEYQSKKYGTNIFIKHDSILAVSRKHLSDVCDLLIERAIDVQWSGMARTEDYLDPALLKKMRKAGCVVLSYGLESGSQKIINKMRKNISLKKAEEVIVETKKAGIKVGVYIMYGYPQESLLDFLKTVRFIFKNRKSIDVVNPDRFSGFLLPGVSGGFDGLVGGSLRKSRRWDISLKVKGFLIALYCLLIYKQIDCTAGTLYRIVKTYRRFFH